MTRSRVVSIESARVAVAAKRGHASDVDQTPIAARRASWPESSEPLVLGLQAGEAWARVALFDRFAPVVERILRKTLGPDSELPDLVHDVFVEVLSSLPKLRDAVAFPAFVQAIAVNTAYLTIRRRRARRWLKFWQPEEVPEVPSYDVSPEVREAFLACYAVLDRMPAKERIVFALRHIDGRELADVAAISGVSLATIKRRLQKAEQRFASLARQERALTTWLREADR